jgi:hypoxanthine phosphoribosyltransferase
MLCKLIADSPDGWWPDAIVAVARGGLVPATHICHYFDCPICFIYNDVLLDTLDSHRRVLVVDEINDTGSAFQRIQSRIFSQPPNDGLDVRYAVLYTRHTTGFEADYFLDFEPYFLRDATWQNFPWERP